MPRVGEAGEREVEDLRDFRAGDGEIGEGQRGQGVRGVCARRAAVYESLGVRASVHDCIRGKVTYHVRPDTQAKEGGCGRSERGEDLDARGRDADLFVRLAEGGGDVVRVRL